MAIPKRHLRSARQVGWYTGLSVGFVFGVWFMSLIMWKLGI